MMTVCLVRIAENATCHVMLCYVMLCYVMLLSITAYPQPIPALSQGEGRVLPGQVASSLQGPHWWAMWGSVSRSRTLRHAAQPCPELGFEPATLRSLVDLLYPLSYSRPKMQLQHIKKKKALCNRKKKIWEEKNEMEREDSREVFTQVSKSCEGIGSLEEVWSGIKTSSFCRNTQN